MLLKSFFAHLDALGGDFLSTFSQPFLLAEGELEGGAEERTVHYLQFEQPQVLGRRRSTDLQILDANVSGRHARLIPGDGETPWRVEDLGSTNGTSVDGKPLQPNAPADLLDLSVVTFGPTASYLFVTAPTFLRILEQLRARGERLKEGTQPIPQLANTVVTQASAIDGISDAAPLDEAEHHDGLFLICDPLAPVPLFPGKTVIVGRSPELAGLVLRAEAISRKHAEFTCDAEGNVTVRDLGSANGIFLGDAQIGEEPVRVSPGQVLRMCDFLVTVRGALPDPDSNTAEFVASNRQRLGNLEQLPLGELLKAIEEAQKSGSLELMSEDLSGTITFRAGEPWRASCGDISGQEAFARLCQLTAGSFVLKPNLIDQGERQLDGRFSELFSGNP